MLLSGTLFSVVTTLNLLASQKYQVYNHSSMKRIRLTQERIRNRSLSVEEAIVSRRSKRKFCGEAISNAELSNLLYYSVGITDASNRLRAAPSAGATYPVELYAVVNNVTDLPKGIYHYAVSLHELEVMKEGDYSRETSTAALNEKMIILASCVFILSAVFQRTRRIYRERADQYIHFEAGHIAQNVYLAATSLGLGACAIGAFKDAVINNLLEIDGVREGALYMIAIGKT